PIVLERDPASGVLEGRPDHVLEAGALRSARHVAGLPGLLPPREVLPEVRQAVRAVRALEGLHEARFVVEVGLDDLGARVGQRLRLVLAGISSERAQGELAPRIAEDRSGDASALGAGGTDYRDDLLVSHESSRISGRRFPAPSVPGVEASESYKGAPVCQKDGFATMSITIRISIAVSNRKTMKRRFTRRPTCGESGP